MDATDRFKRLVIVILVCFRHRSHDHFLGAQGLSAANQGQRGRLPLSWQDLALFAASRRTWCVASSRSGLGRPPCPVRRGVGKEDTMKTSMLMKTVAALASGIFAGTALAGPGDAYLGFPAASVAKASAEKKIEYVTIALPLAGSWHRSHDHFTQRKSG